MYARSCGFCRSFCLQASAVRDGLSPLRVHMIVFFSTTENPCFSPLQVHLKVLPAVLVECAATFGDTRVLSVQHQTVWLSLINLHYRSPCWDVGPELRHPPWLAPLPLVAKRRITRTQQQGGACSLSCCTVSLPLWPVRCSPWCFIVPHECWDTRHQEVAQTPGICREVSGIPN